MAARATFRSAVSARWLPVAFATGLGALLLFGLGTVSLSREQVKISRATQHALEVLATTATLKSDLSIASSEGRGFLVARKEDNERGFHAAVQRVREDVPALRRLVADDSAQSDAIDRFMPAITGRLELLEHYLTLARAGDQQGIVRLVQTRQGISPTQQIMIQIDDLEASARVRLDTRARKSIHIERRLVAGLVICGALAVMSIVLGVVLFVMRRQDRANNADLRASEERMRLLVDGAHDYAIFMLDELGGIATWNVGAERITGYAAGDILGLHHDLLFSTEDAANGHPEALLAAARADGAVKQAFSAVRRDGSRFAAQISVTALFDKAGVLRGYCNITRDVTELHRTENALRESEARFRAMADTIPNMLFEADSQGRNVYVNSSLVDFTGSEPPELVGSGWVQIIHEDDRARVSAAWSRAVRTGSLYEIECRYRRHDGAFRWFLCRGVPIRDAMGAITRWIGTTTDIDDQKQAAAVLTRHRDELERMVAARTAELAASAAQLRESTAYFRLIAEHSRDMVSRTGPDGTLLYVSSACERVFGLPPAAITRDLIYSRLHPDDRSAWDAMRQRLLTGETDSETLAYRLFRADGRLLWVETEAQSLRDPATGGQDGFVGVLRDLTERRRLEADLRHSQKMEVIGRISAGVAHDFNNILQSIISGLELTLESIDVDGPGRRFAELALNSAARGSYLTHHLLSYARKQVLQPRVVAFGPFLHDMQRLLARSLGPHIVVQIDLDGDLPPVRVDPNQLQTALFNLALNAADAMRQGGKLTLAAAQTGAQIGAETGAQIGAQIGEGPERRVVLTVCDTGTGMDAATLAQACEPFFSTKGHDGTGLGLSMVQGFAEQSGGTLHIDSTVGIGTTVELVFRLAEETIKGPPDPAALPQPSRRVLVVDDEPDLLVTAGAFLERAGLWVLRARNGEEALEVLCGELPFDALVTDYAMPGMNGADLAFESRVIRPGLPVVIITGFAEIRGLDTLPGNVQVLHKPFFREDLLKALRQVMAADNKESSVLATFMAGRRTG